MKRRLIWVYWDHYRYQAFTWLDTPPPFRQPNQWQVRAWATASTLVCARSCAIVAKQAREHAQYLATRPKYPGYSEELRDLRARPWDRYI